MAIIAADQPVDGAALALEMNLLREALDAAVGFLQQNLEGRAAPVGQRLAPKIIVAGQADELHRIGDILIEAQFQAPEAIILG